MKEYKKLDSIEGEDIEKIREVAEAMNEVFLLRSRLAYLEDLLDEHDDLRAAVWTTQEGVSKAIADLDDDHLKNIVPYLNRVGKNNTRIRKEYQKRFGEMPQIVAPIIHEADMF